MSTLEISSGIFEMPIHLLVRLLCIYAAYPRSIAQIQLDSNAFLRPSTYGNISLLPRVCFIYLFNHIELLTTAYKCIL
jgi:hypothetical protein